ncbi:hypothetical protein [Streptomyces iranensis]
MLSSESPVIRLHASLMLFSRLWMASSLRPTRMWAKMSVSSVGAPER